MSSEQRCARQQQQYIEKGRGGVSPLCSLRNEEARPIFQWMTSVVWYI